MIRKRKQTNDETDKRIEASNSLRSFAKTLFLILVFMFCNVGTKFHVMSVQSNVSKTFEIEKPDLSMYPIVVRQRLHKELVNEVKVYITSMAPTSKIIADTLVNVCQRYDMDITFVLAQGLIESHFGTKGMALQTNSVFNVGTWDSKKVLCKYKNVNESIEPFVVLIKNDYMEKRTLTQLLRDGGYKNKNGHRYASSPLYEQSLRSTISTITMETSIKMYQDVINLSNDEIMAYFGPTTNKIIGSKNLTASL